MNIVATLAKELSVKETQVKAAVELIDAGNTIPFIARYRKEATGALDDTQLRALNDRLTYLRSLAQRKEEVLSTIEAQEKLTEPLRCALEKAITLAEVEDIYRPFRPKRKTRASTAREQGLEPLAQALLLQEPAFILQQAALQYLVPEKGVETVEQALQGAMDIIAEEIADHAALRRELRGMLWKRAVISSSPGETPNPVYQMYQEYREAVCKIAPHRVLALDRGQREGALKVSIEIEVEPFLSKINSFFLKPTGSAACFYVEKACTDGFSRLLFPSLERELRAQLTENACRQAISVFSQNLHHLLMQPPVGGMVTMGFDPAYRTGCKIAVVDPTGKVLDTTVVYPTPPQNKTEQARQTLAALIQKHKVQVIAIGNGTASRESEQFVAAMIRELALPVSYVIVSEAGASVYSASKLGAEEFPQFDVSLRSAVSIARRLQDPLAELVKIDPKAIGVGQYQHDMPAREMDNALGGVVENCVNSVGVDLNTASSSLLSYVAGINSSTAKNIVAYREENGPFGSRGQLLKVPRLGKKAFEQCAGFLRIPQGVHVLDRTGVHPESYPHAEKLLSLCGYTLEDAAKGAIGEIKARCQALGGVEQVARQLEIGPLTLSDIIDELLKPGRDPRDQLPKPLLRTDVMELTHLIPGMELTGTVRNVIDFGVFVDIGVHEDGLVHISQICDKYIKHPSQVLKVGDIVRVKVLEVDQKRKRISLTMKNVPQPQL